MTQKILLAAFFTLFTTNLMFGKLKIPVGKIDKIEIVADLPDNEMFMTEEGSDEYLDLARFHQEFNIARILPLWITQEPTLVLTTKDSDTYYELTDEQLEMIISENKLDKKKLLQLGFYSRYGGKLILVLILAFIFYGAFPKNKSKDVKPKNI